MIDQFEQRLQHGLEAQADLLPDPPTAGKPMAVVKSPEGRVWPGPLVAFGTAAAVLVVLGASLWLLGATRHGSGAGDSASSETPTGVSAEWRKVDFEGHGWSLGAIASGDKGTVLVGSAQSGGNETAGWFSPDGSSWKMVDALGGPGVVRDLAAGPYGFLATGLRLPAAIVTTTQGTPSTGETPTVWFSADGESWTETALPLPPPAERIDDVVSYYVERAGGASGFLIVAGDEISENGVAVSETETMLPSRPVVWRSSDGTNWDLVEQPEWADATVSGPIAVVGDTVLLVIGHGGEGGYSTVWSSTNGSDWNLAHTFDAGVFVRELAAGPDGFVATLGDGALWFSADGTQWDRVFNPPNGQVLGLVSGTRMGYVLLLSPADFDPQVSDVIDWQTTIYTSVDGRTWAQMGTALSDGFVAIDATFATNGVIVSGYRYAEDAQLDAPPTGSEVWLAPNR